MEQPEILKRIKSLPYFDDFKDFYEQRRVAAQKMFKNKQLPTFEQSEGREILHELANFQILKNKSPKERSELLNIVGALRFVDENNRRADEVAASDLWNVGIDGLKYLPDSLRQGRTGKTTAGLPGFSAKEVPAKTEDRNFVVFDDTILKVLNKYGADGKALRLERKDKGGYAIPETVVPPVEVSKKDIDTLFEAMDEEGALLEFPELGKKLNRYTFNNDRNALIEAITDEDYPAYEAAMKGMLKRTFPSGKIPVRRVENYTELQLFGTKDPETLAMMEQAGLQKLKDQKKIVTEKLIDIDDVKFVGNPAEEELIILDTPRQFRKGAMIGDKQLLSYTINLPKKVEKKAKGGIAGLSDVARDMFKGPKGIGAYQPFMIG